jgi:UDP-N-acetylglucosamine diphosphorylase / glucose-1-phosphate thymidylyltransferase / UDP-N-acetylgalactosamine diphosphorylase / glucosamine-1-phosphate N-acetyltransferase / galactosamine-1-phosphate N-acetyltransferase
VISFAAEMISIGNFIKDFPFADKANEHPWKIVENLANIIVSVLPTLNEEFTISNDIAIHKSAIIEHGVIIKPPVIINAHVFIAANCYLRGGVYLGNAVSVGPGCEIKSSVICANSALAHFNFIGDTLIGSHVNFEAGSITTNFHNDKADQEIYVKDGNQSIRTNMMKFGSLIGDHSKIGANAVLSPGTILQPESIVARLQLVNQHAE